MPDAYYAGLTGPDRAGSDLRSVPSGLAAAMAVGAR